MGLEQKVRVVIVDDHPLFRQGLRAAIDEDARFEVVGEAARADAALSMILQLRPELAVLDVHLPGMTGFDVVSVLRAKQVPTRTVILTMLQDEQAFNTALNLEVDGFVLKENATAEILTCMATVAAGRSYVSPSMTDFLLRRRSRADALSRRLPG